MSHFDLLYARTIAGHSSDTICEESVIVLSILLEKLPARAAGLNVQLRNTTSRGSRLEEIL
jgi:hypothetical protein